MYNFMYALGILILMVIIWVIPVLILWNLLMPHLFGLPTITFWEAAGLNLLSNILFKSTNFKINDDKKTIDKS
jgi:hypothetical protein